MFYFILLTFLVLLFAYKFLYSKTHRYNLPPSPPSFPVAGHLHLLKPPIHKLFHKFSQKYGPIFSLRFGSRRIVVINSSSLVQESFTGQNDVVLTNRPLGITAKLINYNGTTVGTSPYGDHWRNLRRICTTQVLSNHRLNNFLHVRTEEIRQMLTRLSRDTHASNGGYTLVNLEPVLSDLTFNNIVRMVTGKTYYGDDVKEKEEALLFKKLVSDIAVSAGANHPGDYLPVLKLFGNKYEKRVKATGKAMDAFLQHLLDESKSDTKRDSMVSHLLSMQQQQPEYYSDVTIKGLMMGLMAAGTETTAIVLEWAMTNLVKHPEVLEKARLEIEDKIGKDRLIDESDIAVLPYLQNVVSETSRLFPAAPLLIPRATSEDIKIGGYDVPRDTIVVVNAWAIHRDPEIWDEPESFEPDRFSKGGYGREHYVHKLIPFGVGRRICPGVGFGERIVTLVLGTLIQCFDWEKVEGEEIDMSGANGLTMRKIQPLRAMCRPRPIMSKILA
ncbi:unnamed protein product [Thlaspi arvense]|uniref:Cytochrome P450 n=1 Tax=Thlaspi arvense TaxID=13288 RepID=A0AAU9SY02_THLAR|nr:unnamed protein product [Thlaspi arvense]